MITVDNLKDKINEIFRSYEKRGSLDVVPPPNDPYRLGKAPSILSYVRGSITAANKLTVKRKFLNFTIAISQPYADSGMKTPLYTLMYKLPTKKIVATRNIDAIEQIYFFTDMYHMILHIRKHRTAPPDAAGRTASQFDDDISRHIMLLSL